MDGKNISDLSLELVKKHPLEIALFLLSLILIATASIFFIFLERKNEEVAISREDVVYASGEAELESGGEQENLLTIHIAGAVKNPGVYTMPEKSRVADVIEKAQGLSKSADKSFFDRNFNLAQLVMDQEKFYIPTREEVLRGVVLGESRSSTTALESNSAKVSINRATSQELDTLPGVGVVTADKIISQRPYQTIEELVSRKVVGPSLYSKIKELISL